MCMEKSIQVTLNKAIKLYPLGVLLVIEPTTGE